MNRQIIACIFVGLALLILFRGHAILVVGKRVVSRFFPGGLVVSYYKGKDFEEFICRRTEREVARTYDGRYAAWRVPRKMFSARWEGFLHIPAGGEYEFYLQSDDGARLYIDEEKVIDRWNQHNWVLGSHGRKTLKAGKHVLRIEHFNKAGHSAIRLHWCGGPIRANTIVKTPYITKK
ncbi:MAG: PA14 domain-containing protein [Kiritimatiellae bacterium]|nr:PA14 domain-containing protein [Kiritimatiellia bacterium]MDD5522671.1 PA14 domain-containing protein [Kiritimatiellia bacterium]